MADKSTNKKIIAKNTVVLYIRMIVVMLISLYTSRIVLKALGVEDFGLYNVIAGVVSLFAFLRTTLEQTTQRFLNYEMGHGGINLKIVFRACFTIHLIVALIAFILCETIGLWFVNSYINIPVDRVIAANWVYQSVVISLFFTIVTVPFSGDIIAHEKMSYYAVVTIIDAICKLLIAFIIINSSDCDHLILYGILMSLIAIINFLLYFVYSKLRNNEVSIRLLFDRQLFKNIFGFTSWTLLGQGVSLGATQGNNILLNMFHGVASNAAMGIGNQIGSALLSLSGSFQKAFNPQMTKSFAENNFKYLIGLLFSMSKITFILMLICSLPVIYNIDFILDIWLNIVPENSAGFAILFIIQGIINALSSPLNFCINASGKIKGNQITTSCVYASDILILYLLFKVGCPPITAMLVKIYVVSVVLFVRLYYAIKYVPELTFDNYSKRVLVPMLGVSGICILLIMILSKLPNSIEFRITGTIFLLFASIVIIWYITLSKHERSMITKYISNIIGK